MFGLSMRQGRIRREADKKKSVEEIAAEKELQRQKEIEQHMDDYTLEERVKQIEKERLRLQKERELEAMHAFKLKGRKKKNDFGETSMGPALADLIKQCQQE